MIKNLPVFPFTGSLFTKHDGLILNIDHEDNIQAYHEAELITQKVKAVDDTIQVSQIDPLMDSEVMINIFKCFKH